MLAEELASGHVVISKGDLNYRRHFGDRDWPWETPARVAASGVGFRSVLIRVLKSEILVGADRATVSVLAADDPEWLTSGRFGLIQCLW